MCRSRIPAAGPLVFLYCWHCYFDLSKWSEHIFHQRFQLTAPHNATEVLRGGVKSLGVGEAWERKSFFFLLPTTLCDTLNECQTLCPCSVGRMWGYGWCQNSVWHEKKALPSPTTLALCQSLLVVAGFSQLLGFEAAKTFSPRERLTGKIKTCSPYWATTQVNLINAITGLATKSY